MVAVGYDRTLCKTVYTCREYREDKGGLLKVPRRLLTLSMTSKMLVAEPRAVANVCSSGRALPSEKLAISTVNNTCQNIAYGGDTINPKFNG